MHQVHMSILDKHSMMYNVLLLNKKSHKTNKNSY